jgi:FkbM family methyltransferase
VVDGVGEEWGAGRTLRLPQTVRNAGAAVIGRIPMKIRGGPNRGMRWSVVSAGRGAVAGTFERERVAAITSMVQSGDCVWDIGAHKGYVTLAAATRAERSGRVYAFEPAPPNLAYLRRHVEWNSLENVEINPVAVSNYNGQATFGGSGSSITYRLGQGSFDVRVRSIASLLDEGLRTPDVIKIDVEGSESSVLEGAHGVLRSHMLVFVAIHSYDQYIACSSLLEAAGFRVVLSRAVSRILSNKPIRWEADPDILGVGPDRAVDPAALAAFQA